MLRGMGYDPSLHKTKPIFRDKLRDNLLGLGAKALLPGEKLQIKGKRKAQPPPSIASRGVAGAAPGVAAASGIAAAASDETDEVAAPRSATAPEESGSAASTEPAQKR